MTIKVIMQPGIDHQGESDKNEKVFKNLNGISFLQKLYY